MARAHSAEMRIFRTVLLLGLCTGCYNGSRVQVVLRDPGDVSFAPATGLAAPWRPAPGDGTPRSIHTFRLANAAHEEHDVTLSAYPGGRIVVNPPGELLVSSDGLVDLPVENWDPFAADEGRVRVDATGVQIDVRLSRSSGRHARLELGHLTLGVPARNVLRVEIVKKQDHGQGGVLAFDGVLLGGGSFGLGYGFSQGAHPEPAITYGVAPVIGALGAAFLAVGIWKLLTPDKHVPIPLPTE